MDQLLVTTFPRAWHSVVGCVGRGAASIEVVVVVPEDRRHRESDSLLNMTRRSLCKLLVRKRLKTRGGWTVRSTHWQATRGMALTGRWLRRLSARGVAMT